MLLGVLHPTRVIRVVDIHLSAALTILTSQSCGIGATSVAGGTIGSLGVGVFGNEFSKRFHGDMYGGG